MAGILGLEAEEPLVGWLLLELALLAGFCVVACGLLFVAAGFLLSTTCPLRYYRP